MPNGYLQTLVLDGNNNAAMHIGTSAYVGTIATLDDSKFSSKFLSKFY